MKRLPTIAAIAVASVMALAACGERPQTANPPRTDAKAWQGAADPFVASGWTAGDRASWEDQMRNRAQTQNEYNKAR